MQRITLGFQDDVWEYIEQKAKSLGISKNAVVQMAVGRMREQDQVMSFLSQLTPEQIKQAMEKDKGSSPLEG